MNFTDTFIRKPVLAIVVSALILVLGLRALGVLQVRQYPKTQNAVVTITTAHHRSFDHHRDAAAQLRR